MKTSELRKTIIVFLIGLALIYFAIFNHGKSIRESYDTDDKNVSVIKNVYPPEYVKVQGEYVKLSNVEGYKIMRYSVARKTYQENIYVLCFYGVAHEFEYHDRSEAEDMGIYVCMLKGERL